MNSRNFRLSAAFLILAAPALGMGQETKATSPRHITLDEAVQLALKHNHIVRIAGFKVEESKQAKQVARSFYFPTIKNDSNVAHLTDTQFIAIPQGSLGTAAGTPIPQSTSILNQGGLTFVTSGTQLTPANRRIVENPRCQRRF